MKHFKNLNLLSVVVLSFLLLTACKKDLKPGDQVDALTSQVQKSASQTVGVANAIALKTSSPLLKGNRTKEIYQDMVKRLVNPVAATPCNSNTPLSNWLDGQLVGWTPEIIDNAFGFALLDIPGDYAYLFENTSQGQTFGTNGEYNQIMAKTFKDLNRFWDMQGVGIVLAAMHGTTLTNKEKVAKTLLAFYVDSQQDADYYANIIVDLMKNTPQYRNGNHPIFSFNAFASTGEDLRPYGYSLLPFKIVMGDGILKGYSAIGFDDVAPQAILAHEFGHQVQFKLNLVFGNTSEATRRTELMADALSAYYLSHARGATMQWKRVRQFLQVFFNIGDCQFSSTGHHGTPTQRMASADWAYNVANDAQKQGHIISPKEFVKLFDAQLPKIVLK